MFKKKKIFLEVQFIIQKLESLQLKENINPGEYQEIHSNSGGAAETKNSGGTGISHFINIILMKERSN